MNLESKHFWKAIAETHANKHHRMYCYIMQYIDNDECSGFCIRTKDSLIAIKAVGIEDDGEEDWLYSKDEDKEVKREKYLRPLMSSLPTENI